ncbi:MAG: hypothetical protein ACM3ZB_16350 [bacterium]|jgi:hypothetical protein
MARCLVFAAAAAALACAASAQVIEFESSGLRYRTLSREGVTVMLAYLPAQLRNYEIVQVAVSNGSPSTVTIRPEDFAFHAAGGGLTQAAPASTVVYGLLQHAGRDDVIKLVSAYESSLFGIPHQRSTNGYEQRRDAFLAEMGSNKLRAAAAASAIALVTTKLTPGDSTDGAVFFPTNGKPLGSGKITVTVRGNLFEFEADPEGGGRPLRRRTETPAQAAPQSGQVK